MHSKNRVKKVQGVPVYLARGIAICSAVPTIIESEKHILIL
jgi:hypothetical protein